MDNYQLHFLIEGAEYTLAVNIPRTGNVQQLRDLIRKVVYDDGFRCGHLKLFKVEIDPGPLEGQLSKLQVNDFQNHQLSIATVLMSELWEEQPPRVQIHIVVELPANVEGPTVSLPSVAKTHLASVRKARGAPSPSSVAASVGKYNSEQDKRPIYNGRPSHRDGPPVAIYNEALAQLQHDLSDVSKVAELPNDYVVETTKLFHSAAGIYASELDRGKAIYDHLRRLLDAKLDFHVKVPEVNSNMKSAEGGAVVQVPIEDEHFGKKTAAVVYIELKNESGVSGDGGLQAALSLRKHISQKAYDEIRNVSCSPCIIISVAGPNIQISGAVFVEVFTVQNFSDTIHLGGAPFNKRGRVDYVARIFYVVRRAVHALGEYYQYLCLQKQLEPHALLPKPTFLPNSPLVGSLIFKKRLRFVGKSSSDYRRSIFVAEFNGNPVLVKFCETYSEAAHRTLAAAWLAPMLYFCSQIIGNFFIVVMDLVDGQDAYYEFKDRELPPTVLNDVKVALEKLHEAGLVFGDVRRPNIMVYRRREKDEEEWRGMLVDFDLAGPVGKTKYPGDLNEQIKWADGVASAGEIKMEHDLDMLKKLNLGY